MDASIVRPTSGLTQAPRLTYSVFASVSDLKSFDSVECTWSELVARVTGPKIHAGKTACPLLKLASFGDRATAKGSLRHDGNVDLVYGVEGDYDDGLVSVAEAVERLRTARIRAVVYTSARHTPAAPRWRVLAPLSAPVDPSLRYELVSLLNGALGGILAGESWTLSQTYYFGAVKDAPYEAHEVEGTPLDVHAFAADWDSVGPAGATTAAALKPGGTRLERLAMIESDDDTARRLNDRGMIKSRRPDGALNVECPAIDEHTTESVETASVYYLPLTGGHIRGTFVCKHGHCQGRPQADFLQRLGLTPADDFGVVETQRERSIRIGREGDHKAPGQRVMTGSEMLEELIFVAKGAQVSFVAQPRMALPFEEFKRLTAGSIEMTKSASGRAAKVHRAQLWLESKDRKTVVARTFAPGRPAVCQSPDDELSQNLWVPVPADAPADWAELSAPFFEHVAYLVPVTAERERFLDWLAHIEQQPGVLPSTHYLMVARQTGIGRNWMAYALARAFRGYAALGFDLGQALRSGFNGALGQKLLAVVDELHEGGPGGAHTAAAEKLKSMLTEATRLINVKCGRQHTEFNVARFLMFSNHAAALPLADNDRRVIVIENPSERRSEAYFENLYALLDAPGFGPALAEALRRRDITAFNPGAPAPMTEAKARTIRAGRSEVEQAVRDIAADWPSACITSSLLAHTVSQTLGGKTFSTQGACVAAGLVKYGARVKVAGVASHVWVLRDPRLWCAAPPSDVAAEVLRGNPPDAGFA